MLLGLFADTTVNDEFDGLFYGGGLELLRDQAVAAIVVGLFSFAVTYAIATEPVEASDPFLQHKTSRRAVYDRALASHPGAEDVVLWNERDELTETCSANLVLDIGGRKLTPRPESGLLRGTFRDFLLEKGEIEEEVLPRDAMKEARDVFLINSVRLWRLGIPMDPL